MDHQQLQRRSVRLTTAHLADACIRAQAPVRCAPAALGALVPGRRLAGRVAPARHVGSVDVFLEALEGAGPGDVLVVDNGGRLDEACVAAELRGIRLPVFSLGSVPTGPQRLDARPADALTRATVGDWTVDASDLVLGDDDGVLFLPAADAGDIFTVAEEIRDTEARQADRIRAGVSLRSQVGFADYLARRRLRPSLSFREHLRAVGGAIEE